MQRPVDLGVTGSSAKEKRCCSRSHALAVGWGALQSLRSIVVICMELPASSSSFVAELIGSSGYVHFSIDRMQTLFVSINDRVAVWSYSSHIRYLDMTFLEAQMVNLQGYKTHAQVGGIKYLTSSFYGCSNSIKSASIQLATKFHRDTLAPTSHLSQASRHLPNTYNIVPTIFSMVLSQLPRA